MRASLLVLVGKQKGREIPLPVTMFVIGRDPLCHLRPHSDLVSRRHCAIACWNGRVLVRDLKSANGTFLNRKRIEKQIEVRDGDVLDVGDLSFSVQIQVSTGELTRDFDENSVQWLMVEGDDSEVLDPGVDTQMMDMNVLDADTESAEADANEPDAKPTKSKGSKDLSAGKYLKDYLES
jgi:pSer/pThr/pTyr-binding forkhead associated (FHA) protein